MKFRMRRRINWHRLADAQIYYHTQKNGEARLAHLSTFSPFPFRPTALGKAEFFILLL